MWELLLIEYRAQIQHAILLGLCLYAWFKGAGPERWTAAVLFTMVALDYAYHFAFPHAHAFDRVHVGHLLIDLLVLAALVPIATRANRIYPICILAVQLISTVMHLNRGAVPAGMEFAYWLLTRAPSYLQIVMFAIGLALHRRRVARFGSYPSWRKP